MGMMGRFPREARMAEPGQVLSARYTLGRRLGVGGMATVFQGSDRVLDRTVAVKVLAPPFDADPAFVDRFRREAQAAASLSHPNVVAVFDTGSDGPVHYIVMEFVEGATLAEILRHEGAFPPARVVTIGVAICSALDAAHARGLVHRDVKPGNVMLTPAGDLKVTDFGIARATASDSSTRSGVVLGTAAYLSPEQARGEQADARSDLYALGCVLYELVTGRPPFAGESPVAVAYQHVSAEPVPASQIDPAVPAWLDAVIMRALAKDPHERFQSAREMA